MLEGAIAAKRALTTQRGSLGRPVPAEPVRRGAARRSSRGAMNEVVLVPFLVDMRA